MRSFDVIYKYPLQIDEDMKPQIIEMPGYTEVLSVMEQDKKIVLYCKHTAYKYENHDWKAAKAPHKFLVLGTGWEYELTQGKPISGQFVGSVKIDALMWHVYRLW
jgi:hypothetical protein